MANHLCAALSFAFFYVGYLYLIDVPIRNPDSIGIFVVALVGLKISGAKIFICCSHQNCLYLIILSHVALDSIRIFVWVVGVSRPYG